MSSKNPRDRDCRGQYVSGGSATRERQLGGGIAEVGVRHRDDRCGAVVAELSDVLDAQLRVAGLDESELVLACGFVVHATHRDTDHS